MRLLPKKEAESLFSIAEKESQIKTDDLLEKVRKAREGAKKIIDEFEEQKRLAKIELDNLLKEIEKIKRELAILEDRRNNLLENNH